MRDQILVLSFDNRFAAEIATKLRAEKIYCNVLPGDTPVEKIVSEEALGLILAGGLSGELPDSLDGQLLRTGIPLLALGDTAMAVASLLGTPLLEKQEIHEVETVRFYPSRISDDIEETDRFLSVVRPFEMTGDLEPLVTLNGHVLGAMHKTLDIYMIQFQLEPNDPEMMNLLMRFATDVCGCTKWWGNDAFISTARTEISQAAGSGNAVCVMSGGLDSGVAALIAHRALGDRLQCIFIDTGLLREQEAEQFLEYYQNAGLNIMVVDAGSRVIKALKHKKSQAEKKQAILAEIQRVLDETAASLSFDLIIQSSAANGRLNTNESPISAPRLVGEVKTIAPLHELFKEEIRSLGETLGMPPDMTQMQSFPWTGLALRVLGECTKENLSILRFADAVFTEEIRLAGLNKKLWKYFAMLYFVPFTDGHENLVVVLRAVSASHQGGDVRAIPARLPYDLLERYTQRAKKEEPDIAKIVYDVTPGSGIGEIEWN